jgi:hypothetical protein
MDQMHREMIEGLVRKYENRVDLTDTIPSDDLHTLQREVNLIKLESSKKFID